MYFFSILFSLSLSLSLSLSFSKFNTSFVWVPTTLKKKDNNSNYIYDIMISTQVLYVELIHSIKLILHIKLDKLFYNYYYITKTKIMRTY